MNKNKYNDNDNKYQIPLIYIVLGKGQTLMHLEFWFCILEVLNNIHKGNTNNNYRSNHWNGNISGP